MTVATNRANTTNSGAFATSRRGGLTQLEAQAIREMRAKRWGWQTIANVLGRAREDVQVTEAANDEGRLVGGPRHRAFVWTDEALAASERAYRSGQGAEGIAAAVACDLRTAAARYALLRRKVTR